VFPCLLQLEDLATLCQDASDTDANDNDISLLCASGCLGEMQDCHDMLALTMDADSVNAIDAMATMCAPDNADCLTEVQILGPRMDKACGDGPDAPTQCSHDCAVVAAPFLDRCGDALASMMRASGDPDDVAKADGLGAMRTMCDAALKSKH
jgi:hypothetical protein